MSALETMAVTATGVWDLSGGAATNIFNSVAAAVTASTTQTQAGGTALTKHLNNISVCANAHDTVVLPTAAAGTLCIAINSGAAAARLFPASGDNLGAGVNTQSGTDIATGTARICYALDATNWKCWTVTIVA